MKIQFLFYTVVLVLFSGCLVTRQEVREGVKSEPLSPEVQREANNEIRYQELEEQVRSMNGRVEVLENGMGILNADKGGIQIEHANEKKALAERLKIYEETIAKLEVQYNQLAQKVDGLIASTTPKSTPKLNSVQGAFDAAELEFEKKKWNEAILAYDNYRTSNPKGKKYAEATYKIGVSFQELGKKKEAENFFNEVIENFPKSEWAKKTRSRLKSTK